MIYITGPGHGGPGIVANAWLEGTYSEVYPDVSADAAGMKRLFTPVLLPRRHPEPRRARDAGLDPRGRRTGLCAVARLWRGVRQSRPDRRGGRRRRRGGDRPAGDELAFQQVPQPRRPTASSCRSCISTATRSPIPTVLARITPRGARAPVPRLRLHAVLRRRPRPEAMHEKMAETLDAVMAEIRRIKDEARDEGIHRPAALADDHPAHAQGLDLPEGGRRQAHRGLLARPPGAAQRPARQSRARPPARTVDEELPAGGAVRRGRPAARRGGGARARGCAAHERQPARQRRPAAARPAAARLPRLRRRGEGARRGHRRGDARDGPLPARRDEGERGRAELPAVQSRRAQLEPLAGRARGHQPRLGGRDLAVGRSPRARRPGDGDAERASVPGLARRLPADRPARLLLVLRGLHPHRRFDAQPARQVAEGLPPHRLAPADRLVELPAVEPRLAPGP